jgi:uncharacterized membrane protein
MSSETNITSSSKSNYINNHNIFKYIIGGIILFVLDQIWIKITYKSHKCVIEKVQGKKFKKRYFPFYIAIALLIIHFLILIYHKSSVFEAGLHGFILHGIINCYNYAYFEDYDLKHAIIETIYGTVVIAVVMYIVQQIDGKGSKK